MSSDVQIFFRRQLTSEIKKYSPDFSAVLPTGASIPSGSAATTYTTSFLGSGSGSCTTSVNAAGTIPTFTTPALSAVGVYIFTVSASLSDNQVRRAIYYVSVDA